MRTSKCVKCGITWLQLKEICDSDQPDPTCNHKWYAEVEVEAK
jgi:hypothetical protein